MKMDSLPSEKNSPSYLMYFSQVTRVLKTSNRIKENSSELVHSREFDEVAQEKWFVFVNFLLC